MKFRSQRLEHLLPILMSRKTSSGRKANHVARIELSIISHQHEPHNIIGVRGTYTSSGAKA